MGREVLSLVISITSGGTWLSCEYSIMYLSIVWRSETRLVSLVRFSCKTGFTYEITEATIIVITATTRSISGNVNAFLACGLFLMLRVCLGV